MKNETCHKIRLLLVDYSDGALPADKTRQIAAHLAQCPACRQELRLLEHSLALAREVWNESALLTGARPEILPSPFGRGVGGEGDAVSVRTPLTLTLSQRERGPKQNNLRQQSAGPRSVSRRPLALIAGAMAAGAVVLVLLFSRATKPKEEIDVMQYIAREERSARLAASVQLLADAPGLEQYKENAERYLKENYADTAAVRMLEKQQILPQ